MNQCTLYLIMPKLKRKIVNQSSGYMQKRQRRDTCTVSGSSKEFSIGP